MVLLTLSVLQYQLLLELLGYLCHLRYLADLLVLVNPEHLEHLVDLLTLSVLPYQ